MSTQMETEASISTAITSPTRRDVRRPEHDALIAAAHDLAPLIREHSADAERNRRLSRVVIDALRNAGFFRLLLPRSLGGLETDPITYAKITEELARADSAAGWILQAGNTGAWWSARAAREGVQEIYARNPSALMAAAFQPPQQAVEVEGGFRVTGRGPLASNIHDADWLFLTALVMDDGQPRMHDGVPEVIALVLRAREATIVDTWESLGMRGTDSNDVVVDNVFVPRSRTFPLVPAFEPTEDFSGPLYRLPAMAQAAFTFAPVGLGIAREAITELRTIAERKTAFGFTKPMRERTIVQTSVAKAEAFLVSARLLLHDTLNAAWEQSVRGEPFTLEQKAGLLLAGSHAMSTAVTVTTMMHRLAGTSGVYTRNRLERLFRDASTVRHHGFASENRFEAVGQVYLGLPPEFVMVAF